MCPSKVYVPGVQQEKELVQFLEWQGPYLEGSIQSIMVLN